MCAPKVMDYVSRTLSRRDLFRAAGGVAAGVAAASLPHRAYAQSAQNMVSTLSLNNLADLTHTISPRFPVFPGFDPMTITNVVTVQDDGFYANRWDLGEHTGTHLDAPAHFVAGATTADRLPVAGFFRAAGCRQYP